MLQFNLYRSLSCFLFLMCLFPYISFIRLPIDTQPYALVLSSFILFLLLAYNKEIQIPIMLIPYFFVTCYALLMMIFVSDISNGIRSVVGYISVFLIALVSYTTFEKVKGKYFIFSVVVWLIFGFLQMFVNKNFGSFMLSRLATSDERGVTSLAVEPSLYSVVCIFFFILNDIFYFKKEYPKKTYRIIFLIIFIQILFARAGLGVVALGVYLFAKLITSRGIEKKIKTLFSIGLTALILFLCFLYSPSLQHTRVGMLFQKVINDPANIIYTDQSIADRLGHILVSHVSLIYSNGLGFGLGTWDTHVHELSGGSGEFIKKVTSSYISEGRIMSGWGTAIFELGIIGVLFLSLFIFIMLRGARKVNPELRSVYFSSLISIYFVMLMAVPLAFPLFGYTIGVFMKLQNDKKFHKIRTKFTSQ